MDNENGTVLYSNNLHWENVPPVSYTHLSPMGQEKSESQQSVEARNIK